MSSPPPSKVTVDSPARGSGNAVCMPDVACNTKGDMTLSRECRARSVSASATSTLASASTALPLTPTARLPSRQVFRTGAQLHWHRSVHACACVCVCVCTFVCMQVCGVCVYAPAGACLPTALSAALLCTAWWP